MVAILQKRTFRDFDWLVAVLAIAIVSFGAWEIHNAQPTETFWQKQLIGLGIAMVAMLAIAFSDYRRLVELAPLLLPSRPGIAGDRFDSRHRHEDQWSALLD